MTGSADEDEDGAPRKRKPRKAKPKPAPSKPKRKGNYIAGPGAGKSKGLQVKPWKEKFLRRYAETMNVYVSCRDAGVSREWFYQCYRKDTDFRALVDMLKGAYVLDRESSFIVRSLEGWWSETYRRDEATGQMVLHEKKHQWNPSIALATLERIMPERWAPKRDTDAEETAEAIAGMVQALRRRPTNTPEGLKHRIGEGEGGDYVDFDDDAGVTEGDTEDDDEESAG